MKPRDIPNGSPRPLLNAHPAATELAMTDAGYTTCLKRLTVEAQALSTLDLVGFVERIEKAESVGPVLNPTLYRKGIGRLEAMKALAIAARRVQDTWREFEQVVKRSER